MFNLFGFLKLIKVTSIFYLKKFYWCVLACFWSMKRDKEKQRKCSQLIIWQKDMTRHPLNR